MTAAVFFNSVPASTQPVSAPAAAQTEPAPATRFDEVFGRAQAKPAARSEDRAPAAKAPSVANDPRADARTDHRPGPAASESGAPDVAAAKPGQGVDGERQDDHDQPASAAVATEPDPRAVLGWLQGQTAAPPAADSAPGSANAAASVPVSTANMAPVALLASLVQRAVNGKAGAAPDDAAAATPLSASAPGVGDAEAGAGERLPFRLPALGATGGEGAALTPALSAALSAALGASADAAPAVVARGVEQFQALLARPEAAAPSVPAAATSAATPAATTNLATAPLALDAPDLPVRLGERLQWLVDGGVQEARLQLHPREFGTINVQVRIESRGASVWFAAEHPAARAALESSLPILRERFAGDGLALGQAQVTAQSSGWSSPGSQQQASSSGTRGGAYTTSDGDTADASAEPAPAARTIVHVGLIDRYA